MCCGTKHGWTEPIRLAKDPDPSGRDRLRSDADEAWRAAVVGQRNSKRSSKKIGYPKKIAGIDSGVANLVDWLAEDLAGSGYDTGKVPPSSDDDPSGRLRRVTDDPTVTQVEELGNLLVANVLRAIKNEYPGPVPKAVKVALADHFWCDVLAQLVRVIDVEIKLIDNIPNHITRMILKSREDAGLLPLEELVVKAAVKSIWGYFDGLVVFGNTALLRRLLPAMRILAVLMCKAPERHQAVVVNCLDPLRDLLIVEIKKRLVTALREWLPQMESELANTTTSPPGRGPSSM